ncbi:hypothetical protein LLE49_22815 [Alicyclobacillus tolerans]|uniref:hypothetical protein n=1 Tax=Alicyclobacillus tolerans TaxID=90970 RepID=UPI001F3BEA8E|nr:hypothetical protein [Alicyclobacillus tolerans]MCF8567556.1 hypothetical protein [Alicyclobacillus tolerans]
MQPEIMERISEQGLDQLLDLLDDSKIQSAAISIVSKLPTIAQWLETVEVAVDLVSLLVKNQELRESGFSAMEKLLSLKDTETVQSTLELAKKVPKMIQLVTVLEALTKDVVEPLSNDPEIVSRIQTKAAQDTSNINALTLLKLVKHPVTQQMIRTGMATMDAIQETKVSGK